SEQTFDKVDNLLITLDNKVDDANLKDLALFAPLKNAQLFPELQALASAVANLKQTVTAIDKQAVLVNLQEKLQASLATKFPEDKAKELAQNLINIAQVLASEQKLTSLEMGQTSNN
ncbi:MAG: hypothetical protein ACRDBQ_03795, partial [Shewanella sp.]